MRKLLVLLLLLLTTIVQSQNFTQSGKVYGINNTGVTGVKVQFWKQVTPTISGFTSQTNYSGHSYYRSTGTATWTTAQSNCAAMGGHLVTMSNAAENTFVYNTWSSGWIGYYQDHSGAFYSEPNGGWRWTENYTSTGMISEYDISNASSYSGTGSTVYDLKSMYNGVLYNSPTYTSTGGKYITFNGTNQYLLSSNMAANFIGYPKLTTTTILVWIYPSSNGVIVDELGDGGVGSGWHDSQIEITGVSGSNGTLRMAMWGQSGNVNTSITLNVWHLVGLTYDGTTLTGYKDGVSFGTATFNRAAPYNNGNINMYYALGLSDGTNLGNGSYANFRLGDFQVFNAALTADQMNRNYMSTAWRFGVYPYSNWNSGEPNNSGGEDYIQFVGSGLWNDLNNTNSLNYVLEFDYVVTTGPWTLDTSIVTNTTGDYSVTRTSNPSIAWKVVIDSLSITSPSILNAGDSDSLVVGKRATISADYYRYDINLDGGFSVSDIYLQLQKRRGKTWSVPTYRIFLLSDYNTIRLSTADIRTTYPGTQSTSNLSPTSGGVTNFYILRTGYAN
jgi:hypothetical protein